MSSSFPSNYEMFRNAAAAASRNSDKREALKQFKSALNLLTKAQFKYDVTFNIVYQLDDNFYTGF